MSLEREGGWGSEESPKEQFVLNPIPEGSAAPLRCTIMQLVRSGFGPLPWLLFSDSIFILKSPINTISLSFAYICSAAEEQDGIKSETLHLFSKR